MSSKRKLHIGEDIWLWVASTGQYISSNVVIWSPSGKKLVVNAAHITGYGYEARERSKWKQYRDRLESIKPGMVKSYILSGGKSKIRDHWVSGYGLRLVEESEKKFREVFGESK